MPPPPPPPPPPPAISRADLAAGLALVADRHRAERQRSASTRAEADTALSAHTLVELERFGWYALAVYGWPLYVWRRSGRCLLALPLALTRLLAARLCRYSSLDEAALMLTLRDYDRRGHVHDGRHHPAYTPPPSARRASGDGVRPLYAELLDDAEAARDGGSRCRRRRRGGEGVDGSEGAGAALSSRTLQYASWANDVGQPCFAVLAEPAERTVVLAIRGTLSLSDVVTDTLAASAALPADVDGGVLFAEGAHAKPPAAAAAGARITAAAGAAASELPMAHEGMLRAATLLFEQLEREGVLRRLLLEEVEEEEDRARSAWAAPLPSRPSTVRYPPRPPLPPPHPPYPPPPPTLSGPPYP